MSENEQPMFISNDKHFVFNQKCDYFCDISHKTP